MFSNTTLAKMYATRVDSADAKAKAGMRWEGPKPRQEAFRDTRLPVTAEGFRNALASEALVLAIREDKQGNTRLDEIPRGLARRLDAWIPPEGFLVSEWPRKQVCPG